MTAVPHTVTLRSNRHFGRRVPLGALAKLLAVLPAAVRQSILMAVQGRSSVRGRQPRWLDPASDIRFIGHSGKDETVLHFEAPPLGEAAEELYRQTELWPTRPDSGDTGFDLLSDVVSDVYAGNQDSDRFDSRLLRQIVRFGRGLNGAFQTIAFSGHRYSESQPAVVDHAIIQTAERLFTSTPSPQRVRVVGKLDMIRGSTQAFALKLEGGEEVQGVLTQGQIDQLAQFFQQTVLVLGQSVFRPSGRLLRIDAQEVSAAGSESTIWSRMPTPGSGRLDASVLRRPQRPSSGTGAIVGQWPGDETDDEIRQLLEEIS
jgi:hypothetical protein